MKTSHLHKINQLLFQKNTLRIGIFWLCFLLQAVYAFAQTEDIAQLKNIINRNAGDIAQVNALNKLSEITYKTSHKEAEKYADKALELAIKINYDEGLADALTILGNIDAYHNNDPERAYEYHQRAYLIYKKMYQANQLDKWKIYNFLKEHAIPSYRILYAKNSQKKKYQKILISYQTLNNDYVEYLASLASETKSVLDKTTSELKSRERDLISKEDEIRSKDDEIYRRERELANKEREITNKEREIRKNRKQLQEKYSVEELLNQINKDLADSLSVTDSAKKALSDKILAQEYLLERNKRKLTEQRLRNVEKENKLKESRIATTIAILGAAVVIVIVLILYRSYKKQQKAYGIVVKQKELLEEQRAVLTQQKKELERKNLEIVQQNEEIVKKSIEIEEQKEELENRNVRISEQLTEIEQINAELAAQRDSIEESHRELGRTYEKLRDANNDVRASITYAQRIQNAFLPSNEEVKKVLKDYFVLFKPRDIVSGDFYWLHQKEQVVFVAAVDCTGHGVPGAFMSILADTLLSQIILDKEVEEPAKILLEMHLNVRKLLRQAETGNRDGMDAAIIAWHKAEQKIIFAGAKNPIYLIKEVLSEKGKTQELVEIKGDISPIGGQQKDGREIRFKQHEIDAKLYHTLYMFSDGYHDQFGGTNGRKFMSGNFKRLLTEIAHKPMNLQKAILVQKHEEWKGERWQVDDILIMGIRLQEGYKYVP